MGPLTPIFLTVLVDVLALTIVLPLLPFYAAEFGASKTVIGALFASFAVCQLFSGPVLGRLSDRLGRKPVLVVSQLGTCAGLLIMGFADRLEWLFVGRMLDGLTAGNLSIAQAYIADVTAPERRTRAFALVGIAFGVGFLVGPAFAGAFASRFGHHAPFLFAAGLSLASAVLTTALLPRTGGTSKAVERGIAAARRVLSQPAPRQRLLEMFTFLLSFALLTGGLALFLEARLGFGVAAVGWTFAYAGLVGGLMQGLIGRLAKRFGESTLSAVGICFMAAGLGLLGLADTVTGLGVALTIGSAGSSVVRPALTTLLTSAASEADRGLALGTSQSLASVAQIVGPSLAGWLIDHGRLGAWTLLMAASALTMLVVRWLFGRHRV